jgi:hypothetical protein
MSVALNVNCDINELLQQIGQASSWRKAFTSREGVIDQGDRWISLETNGLVISAYYHPTKKHGATAQGGGVERRETKSIAEAGRWAVAYCQLGTWRAIFGPVAKTFYKTID